MGGCISSVALCAGVYVENSPVAVALPYMQAQCLAETNISDAFASSCVMPMEWEGAEEGAYATFSICCYGDFCCGNQFAFTPEGDVVYAGEPDCERLGFNVCEALTCLADDGGHCEEVEDAFCASNFTDILGDDLCLTTTTTTTNTPTASPVHSSSESSDVDSGSGRPRGRGRGRGSDSGSDEELFAAALNPNTRTQSDEHIRSEKIARLFGFDLLKSGDFEKSGISMAEFAKKFEAGKSGSVWPHAKSDGDINILDGDEAETKTITVSVAQNTFLSFAIFGILLISNLSCCIIIIKNRVLTQQPTTIK